MALESFPQWLQPLFFNPTQMISIQGPPPLGIGHLGVDCAMNSYNLMEGGTT